MEKGGHTSSLWGNERAGDYGSREAYHLIFYFLSECISALFCERGRRINTFIFCTVVMIDCVRVRVFSKRKFNLPGCRLATGSLAFFTSPSHSLTLPGPLSFSYPHNLSCDWPVLSPQPNSSEDPFLIFYPSAPGSHYVRRPILEARNCPGS